MKEFILWVMLFLSTNAPPGRPQFISEAKETKEEAVARYESIATDLQEVLREEPALFTGKYAKARTATVLLSLILHESGVRRDVDLGIGKQARGDGGRSWCLLQQNIGTGRTLAWNTVHNRKARRICKEDEVSSTMYPCDPSEEVHPGWTGPELVTDRKNCFRAGIRVIRSSFAACRNLPTKDWLRSYASGSCQNGSEASARRMNLAMVWFSNHRPTETDDVLFAPPKQEQEEQPSDLSNELVSLR